MFGQNNMGWARNSAIVLVTLVLIAGIGIPLSRSPQSWLEFPVIPGLGQNSRNLFFHVPMAWTTVVAFLVSMFYGYRYLKTKEVENDLKSVSSAGLGLLFCALATMTGAVWAKFNWGEFWNWDPRQTSIFILLLIYGAYFALRSAVEPEERRATLSAVYAVLGGLMTPFFIFVMPRMMSGLHPGAKGDPEGLGPVLEFKMSPNMLVVFLLSLAGFTLLYFWLFNLRVRVARLEYEASQHQS